MYKMGFFGGTNKDPMCDLSQLFWKKENPGRRLVHLIVCLCLPSCGGESELQISHPIYELTQPQFQSWGWKNSNHSRMPSPELDLESPSLMDFRKVSQTLHSFSCSTNFKCQLRAINNAQQDFSLTKDGCGSGSLNKQCYMLKIEALGVSRRLIWSGASVGSSSLHKGNST